MNEESNVYKIILIVLLAISLALSFIGIMIAIIFRLVFPIIGIILIIIEIIAIVGIAGKMKYGSILALIIGIYGIVSNTISLVLYFYAWLILWYIFYLIYGILIIIFAILEFNQVRRYQQIVLQAPTPIQQTISPQQAATTEQFKYCTNCGAKVTGNFCEHCGTKLT